MSEDAEPAEAPGRQTEGETPEELGESAGPDGTPPLEGELPSESGEHSQDGDAAGPAPGNTDPIAPTTGENGPSEEGVPAGPDDQPSDADSP